MTLTIPFDFTVTEDRRGINFEGVEAGHPDPEGALNLQVRVARDHLVLSVWPVKGEIAQVTDQLGGPLGGQIPQRETCLARYPETEGVAAALRKFVALTRFAPAVRPMKRICVEYWDDARPAGTPWGSVLRGLGFRGDANQTLRYEEYR